MFPGMKNGSFVASSDGRNALRIFNKQSKKRYEARVAGRPALSVHDRLRRTVADASERVLVRRVRAARDLVVSRCLHYQLYCFRPARVERSRVARRVEIAVRESQDGRQRVDFELSLEDVRVHGVLRRALDIKGKVREDESSGALRVVVGVRIRMACFVEVESVRVRIDENVPELPFAKPAYQRGDVLILLRERNIVHHLRGRIAQPHGGDIPRKYERQPFRL